MRVALWPDAGDGEVEAVLSRPWARYALLVAERSEGGLCGFAEVGTREYGEGCGSSPVAYLEGIWVDPDVRRLGVARRLVLAAEAWGRSLGLAELASDCRADNVVSEAFHRAVGFDEVGRIVCFRRAL